MRNILILIIMLTGTTSAFSQYLGGAAQREEEERLRHKKLICAADIVSCEIYSVGYYDGQFSEPGSLANILTYDKNGNPVKEIKYDLDGGMATEYIYRYDSSDHIIFESFGSVKGKIFTSKEYYYSGKGRLEKEKVTEPEAKFSIYYRNYSYSILGTLLLETVTDTLGHVIKQVEYTTNNAGYLLSAAEKRGDGSPIFTTNYTYDKKNRLILTSEEDKDGQAGDEIRYTFDRSGRLIQEAFVSKFGLTYLEYTYKYNDKGQLAEQRENDPQEGSLNITRYAYNDYGLVSSETWYDRNENPLERIDYYYKTR